MSNTAEHALERWFAAHDAEALKTLVDLYAGKIYAVCCRMLGDPGEAEDVAQECFQGFATAKQPPTGYLGPIRVVRAEVVIAAC